MNCHPDRGRQPERRDLRLAICAQHPAIRFGPSHCHPERRAKREVEGPAVLQCRGHRPGVL